MNVPAVAAAITVAKQLNALLRRKTSESLTQILDAAIATPACGRVPGRGVAAVGKWPAEATAKSLA